jgi:hypothetical protein
VEQEKVRRYEMQIEAYKKEVEKAKIKVEKERIRSDNLKGQIMKQECTIKSQ